jgi:hypothetical protein
MAPVFPANLLRPAGFVLLVGLLAAGCAPERPDLDAGAPADLLDRLAAGVVYDDVVDPGAPGCRAFVLEGWLAPEPAGRASPGPGRRQRRR